MVTLFLGFFFFQETWSKLDKDRQMWYNIAYMWNIKNNDTNWTYLQNRNEPTDIENKIIIEFSSVQSLSLVQLFVTPQIAACQASLSIKSVMPSNYLILYHPLFPFLSLVKVVQLCRTLWDPMDYTVHGLLQARILEWVAFSFSRVSSLPRSSSLQEDSLPAETQGKPNNTGVGSLSLRQWIFLTQGSNWGLLNCRWYLYQLSYQGSPWSQRVGHDWGTELKWVRW